MRVIARSTLVKFWSQPEYADSKGALQSWFDEAIKASWKTPQDIKEQYRSASICNNNCQTACNTFQIMGGNSVQ